MTEPELHPDNFNHLEIAHKVIQDNPVLAGKICKAAEIGISDVLPLMTETIRFLNLIAYQKVPLTPSLKVDLAWHEVILCTRYYQTLCTGQWGRFIHHNPAGKPAENKRNFEATLKLYQEHYGKAPAKYWGELTIADCGGCEAMRG